eukprot:609573-Prymnesium_polylepis.1
MAAAAGVGAVAAAAGVGAVAVAAEGGGAEALAGPSSAAAAINTLPSEVTHASLVHVPAFEVWW